MVAPNLGAAARDNYSSASLNFVVGAPSTGIVRQGTVGDDTLIGTSGNDSLNGGLGANTLIGGAGNDRFLVSDLQDLVIETSGGGC